MQQQEVQQNQALIKQHVLVFKNKCGTRQSFSTKYYWAKKLAHIGNLHENVRS